VYIYADEAWLEKIVTNPITHRKDKVKSLPPEIQKQYRPDAQHQIEDKPKSKSKSFEHSFDENLKKLQELHDLAHKTVFEGNKDTMNAEKYHSEMATHNVVSKVPKGFIGKISKDGKLLTSHGKELDKAIGKDVKMNKKYNPKTDNNIYCWSINQFGKKASHYTKDCLKRHKHLKFLANKEFGANLPNIRDKVSNDLKSEDQHKQLLALMVTLCDQAYFRIGNRKSEKDGVFGLHNLQSKHISFDNDGNIHFNYIGKEKVPQHQIIAPDDHIRKMIQGFVKDKNPDDYVFTHKGHKLDTETINAYMKKDLGAKVTIHRFRTFHASRIMDELLKQVPEDASPKDAMNAFHEASKVVAGKMGHERPATTLKNYIDHNIPLEFFKKYGITAPKEIAQLARSIFMFKANSDIIPVTSEKKITPEDINFINWMDGMVFDFSKDKTSSSLNSIEKISSFLQK